MITVCAWCQKYMGTKHPFGDPTVTHGICATCALRQQLGEMPTLVIAREHAETLPLFQNLLTGVPEIQVVVDRRQAERRSGSPPSDGPYEQRRTDERRQSIRLFLA
jgi:hypothetical protein